MSAGEAAAGRDRPAVGTEPTGEAAAGRDRPAVATGPTGEGRPAADGGRTGSGDPHDPSWFRQVLGQYPTGVCAITAIEPDGRPAGFVVGSFTSVSLTPPLVAFLPNKSSTSWPKIERAGRFCVNVLGSEHERLCRRLAERDVDRFEGVSWRPAPSGAPILTGVVAWIDCDLETVTEAGDHYLVLGRVKALDVEAPGMPLLFFRGGYGRFTTLSLAAANAHGALSRQLREVDIVRGELERLAGELSARCIATARAGEMLAVIASAGADTGSSAATFVGLRLPLTPPTGAVFAAWAGDAELEGYLSAIREQSGRERAQLRAVRERGYSIGLLGEQERTLASVLDTLASDPDAMNDENLVGLTDELEFDPVELTAAAKAAVRSITVPVFGADGEVALAITVYGFSGLHDEAGAQKRLERCLAAGRAATERLRAAGVDATAAAP
ncbi:MAG: flavin reductase [Solirubrobacteraceae bacterium]